LNSMHRNHMPGYRARGRRPNWWPANEPWPPNRANWSEWSGGRGRLFRRLGCLFGLSIFTGLIVFSLMVILVANAVGVIQISGSLGWIIPLGGIVLLVGFGLVVLAGRGLRRLSQPLGDLIEAAEGISEGDYSRRVTVRGPQEIRPLLRTFNHMAEHLETSAEQRRNFMADVTHELRTPLTVIQGNLEGMIDGVYPADDHYLRATLEETQLLDRLVGDLRTLALAESGALQLRKEPVDLAVLIGESAAAFQNQADAQGVTLTAEIAPEAGMLDLDGERIRQVLANLLANALRYTPAGGNVRVRLTRQPHGSEPRVQIEVQDSGRGIPAQDLDHVFDRFYKGSDSSGMGLGLSIAKTLVEAHGGTIGVASQPGQGTTFTIQLP
jgi:two-component system, OmpR family, sensor histidine kinase BaeS